MTVTSLHFQSAQSFSRIQLFATPWTAADRLLCPSLSPRVCSSSCPSNHVIFCHPLLLLPSAFPNIRVFSNESALHIRWPKYWSISFSISSPMNIQDRFHLGLTGLISCRPRDCQESSPAPQIEGISSSVLSFF